MIRLLGLVSSIAADRRYGARRLRHSPGFALIGIVTLGLGIGSSTAIFSAVNPILFEPLPYPDAGRIMMIWYAGADGARGLQTFGTYRELQARSRAFEALAVYKPWQRTMTASGAPERLDGQQVSAPYFHVLGVPPALGRDFDPVDDRPGGPRVVILSDALWRRRFFADTTVIGRPITLDDVLYTVIGVMPIAFENVPAPSAEMWSLLQYDPSLPPLGREWGHHLTMVGRVRPGNGIDQATRDLDEIARTPIPEFVRQPGSTVLKGLIVNSLRDDVTGGVKPALFAVVGAVLLLLTIACVNVMNLLLARGANRRGEFAMRAALGAGRGRLIRQLLTESALLALLGGALGMVIAEFGVRALVALSPPGLPRAHAIVVNGAVFGFAFGVATLIGLAVGAVPALHASGGGVRFALQRGSSRNTRGHHFLRRALVVSEVALALVLLVSAGLMLRSIERVFAVAAGFDTSHLLTMQVQLSSPRRFPDATAFHRFYAQALDKVREIPGVASAAFTSELPLSGDSSATEEYGVQIEQRSNLPNDRVRADRYAVTAGYFDAMSIPLRRGRLFEPRDAAPAPVRPIVVSESFAKSTFHDQEPIGQRLRFGGPANRPWDVIVGVVGDVKQTSLAAPELDAVYVVTDQWLWADTPLWLVVRARGDAAALTPRVKSAVWSVDKDQPIERVATMDQLLAASEAERHFVMIIFELFGLVALLLAAIGLYGVLAGSVVERTREIGVRAALGASRADVLGLVLGQGLTLTGVGVAIGLIASVAATRGVSTLLFGVSRIDPATYVSVVALLTAVSAIACGVPAWRAARVDPSITLRAE